MIPRQRIQREFSELIGTWEIDRFKRYVAVWKSGVVNVLNCRLGDNSGKVTVRSNIRDEN